VPTIGLYLRVFVVAIAVNFVWEMMQARFYAPMGTFWGATWRCLVASLGDGAMIVSISVLGAALFRSWRWFTRPTGARLLFAATAGLAVGIAVEWWALRTGRWQYNTRMPLVPGTVFGVVPLAQMVLLAPVTLWISTLLRRHTIDLG
jgi:hypothetical protein